MMPSAVYAECHYAKYQYADCRYAACRYAENRGALKKKKQTFFSKNDPKPILLSNVLTLKEDAQTESPQRSGPNAAKLFTVVIYECS
jgi:hypothetical protein